MIKECKDRFYSSAPLAVIAAYSVMVADPAFSTVFEYNGDGTLTVTEKGPKPAQSSLRSAPVAISDSSALRELTRTVGIRFSGEPGVRKAGLSALTFVDVFEALIDAESSFNPNAVSSKGAQGLGQLMPDTASDLGVSDPFDPHQNLVGAAQYLTAQLLEFGTLELALAAYNAGPARVREYNGIPPFKETRDYISQITRKSGAQRAPQAPSRTQPVSVPINKEEPLKGETSVWEF